MAKWYLNRPPKEADETELQVVQSLREQLGDGWTVRWGYHYSKGGDQAQDREGDLIIQGPCGRILIMEIKGGSLRHFANTGAWESQSNRGNNDNPINQLFAEWKAIVKQLNQVGKRTKSVPYIGKALCCPNVEPETRKMLLEQNDPDLFIFNEDLQSFTTWWKEHIETKASFADSAPAKDLFQKVLLPGMQPKSVELFLSHSDQLFRDFQRTEFEVLEMLQQNHHWLIEGGVGTGKNFMALKQAEIAAQTDKGHCVLLLVYNLLLAERMRALVENLELARGSIVVRSWEELTREIIAFHQEPPATPELKEEKKTFYVDTIPSLVEESFATGKVEPQYDVLVVAEAQEHHTQSATTSRKNGWWDWYFKLLKNGTDAPIYLFADSALRSEFSEGDQFDIELAKAAIGAAVHVQLSRTVRYTQPIFNYLSHLCLKSGGRFGNLKPRSALPTGPNLMIADTTKAAVPDAVREILVSWTQQGYTLPDQVVLIGKRSTLANSSLGGITELLGYELADYEEGLKGKIAYINAQRARGLDFRSVILIDFPPMDALFSDTKNLELQKAFFLGASRTRQLLGVVSVVEEV